MRNKFEVTRPKTPTVSDPTIESLDFPYYQKLFLCFCCCFFLHSCLLCIQQAPPAVVSAALSHIGMVRLANVYWAQSGIHEKPPIRSSDLLSVSCAYIFCFFAYFGIYLSRSVRWFGLLFLFLLFFFFYLLVCMVNRAYVKSFRLGTT